MKMVKIVDVLYRIFIGLIVSLGLVCFYNIEKISSWLENRLIEKFEVNVVIKDNKDIYKTKDELEKIVDKYTKINFIEKQFFTKKDVWELVSEKEELKYFSTLITRNPFPDILKLKFSNFYIQELNLLLEELKTNSLVKEIVYDTNIFSYLDRLTKIKKYLKIVEISMLIFGIFIIIFSIYKIYLSKKIFVLESVIVCFGIIAMGIINYRILDSVKIQISFKSLDFLVFLIVTFTSLSIMNMFNKNDDK